MLLNDVSLLPKLEPGFYGDFPSSFTIHFAGMGGSSLAYYWALMAQGKEKVKDEESYEDYGDPEKEKDEGEAADGLTPLYAVSNDGKHLFHTTLHSKPDINSSPLAIAGQHRVLTTAARIVMPRGHGAEGEQKENRVEQMALRKSTLTHETYTWSFPVPSPADAGELQTDTFEWRKPFFSSSRTRTLFRRGTGVGTSEKEQKEGEAICTWVSQPWKKDKSTLLGTVSFLGSGATGELGAEWKLMAVMTILRLLSTDMGWTDLGRMMKGSGKMLGEEIVSVASSIGVEAGLKAVLGG